MSLEMSDAAGPAGPRLSGEPPSARSSEGRGPSNSEDLAAIYSLLAGPYKSTLFLTHPYVMIVFIPQLLYLVLIYLILGEEGDELDFYTGFVYSFNYIGVAVAYWIIIRQSRPFVDHSNVISNEIVDHLNCLECSCVKRCLAVCSKYRSTHFLLLGEILTHLKQYPKSLESFQLYCNKWKMRSIVVGFFWVGIASLNIILRAIPDNILSYPESFDDKPEGLYGYYNLVGQFMACLILLTGGVTMLTGLFEVRSLVIGYATHLRSTYYKGARVKSERLIRAERKTFLNIQKLCLAMSELWSTPILVSLFASTQVIISNIIVIHHMAQCVAAGRCTYAILYPVFWLGAGLWVTGTILRNIAQINMVAQTLVQIFVFSDDGFSEPLVPQDDYSEIGGRRAWIDYFSTNKLEFRVSNLVITPSLVINSGYTVATAIASFLAADLL